MDTTAALQHFESHDPIMEALLKRALSAEKPITIPKERPQEEYFSNIVRSIVSQQISVAAAAAVNTRIQALLKNITPATVLAVPFKELKSCGLSQKKTEYIKHNAAVWDVLPTEKFSNLSNQALIAELTKLYGIGTWTAEMFLIFSLARQDVFSYGDLGLMTALCRQYNYYPHYTRKISATVDNWSPYKTVASLTLWHTIDNGPVFL